MIVRDDIMAVGVEPVWDAAQLFPDPMDRTITVFTRSEGGQQCDPRHLSRWHCRRVAAFAWPRGRHHR
jgi:hypothetical protein